MKKIISLIMSLIIISSVLPAAVYAEENETYSQYESYCYDTLVGLGIVDENEEISRMITKGEFCGIVANMLKISGESNDGALYFRDVSPDHEYYDSICAMARHGYIFGDDSQRVYPDKYITKETALVILVRALGYETMAKNSGGYIAGYANLWNNLDLDKGLNDVLDKDFTLSKVCVALYNSLLAKQPGNAYSSNAGFQIEAEGGATLLYSLYNGYEFKGIVNKNGYTSLVSSDRYKDSERVRIGDVEMNGGETGIGKYLGYEIVGITVDSQKGAEDYTVVSFTTYNKNDGLTIRGDKLLSVPDTLTVKYDDGESNKTRTAKLTRNVSVIYNYQYISSYTEDDLYIDNGYLKLVDNNRDGEYDVVFVFEYTTYFVSGVDTLTGYIYDTYGYEPIVVDDQTVITDAYGTTMSIAAVQPNDILSVYKPKHSSEGSVTVIEKSMAQPVEGEVESLHEDDGTIAVIDGKEYRVSDRYAALSQPNTTYRKIKLGMKGIFYINDDTEIYAIEVSACDFIYAYLISIGVRDWDYTSKCKVYTQYGEFKELSFHEKLKINGSRVDDIYTLNQNTLLCSGGKAKPQLVKYKTDAAGLITELLVSDGTKVLPTKYSDTALNYNGKVTNGEMRSGAKKYNYEYLYNDDTVIFIIPADLKNQKGFQISNKVFSDAQKLTLNLYDTDSSYIFKAAVAEGGDVKADFESEPYLVALTSVGVLSINENDELVEEVKGYYKGVLKTFSALQEDNLFDGFKAGDIVHIMVDATSGNIMGTKKMFTFDDAGNNKPTTDSVIYHDEFAMKKPHDTNPIPTRIYGATGMVYGKCMAKGDNYVTLTLDGGTTGNPFTISNDVNVYVVEKDGKKINVTPSSTDAIMVASSPTAGNGSKVLLNTRNAIVREIFIIKE